MNTSYVAHTLSLKYGTHRKSKLSNFPDYIKTIKYKYIKYMKINFRKLSWTQRQEDLKCSLQSTF